MSEIFISEDIFQGGFLKKVQKEETSTLICHAIQPTAPKMLF
jgi:hypothetical protein